MQVEGGQGGGEGLRARETQLLGVFWQLVMAPIQQELGSTAEFSHLAPWGQNCHVSQSEHVQHALWHREVWVCSGGW